MTRHCRMRACNRCTRHGCAPVPHRYDSRNIVYTEPMQCSCLLGCSRAVKCWKGTQLDTEVCRNSTRTRPQSSRGPPPAPPLQDIPPPPPPPPPGSDGGGPPQQVFWTRRKIFATLLVGSGLWYWRNYDALDPHVTFLSRDSTPNGMQLMVSPTGEPYGITMIPTKTGDTHMMMLDAYGNIYYDPNDRSLGIYIVCSPSTMICCIECCSHRIFCHASSNGMLCNVLS